MPIEKFEEIPEYLEKNKDSEEVKGFITKLNPLSTLTEETANSFIETNAILKSHRDKFTTAGIETFKKNNLQKSIDEAVEKVKLELNPEETPEQKRIKELEKRSLESDRKLKLSEIVNDGITYASKPEIGVPADLVKIIARDSHETTKANIDALSSHIKTITKTALDKFVKEKGRVVTDGADNIDTLKTKYDKAKKDGNVQEAMRLNTLIHKQKQKEK